MALLLVLCVFNVFHRQQRIDDISTWRGRHVSEETFDNSEAALEILLVCCEALGQRIYLGAKP